MSKRQRVGEAASAAGDALSCTVGILRLDGAAYSAPVCKKVSVLGDAASPETFHRQGADVLYQRAEGYNFSTCQVGLADPLAKDPVFKQAAEIKIRGKASDPEHLFIPNRRTGASNAPRQREPTRTEPWYEDGVEVGVNYIYESDTLLVHLRRALVELAEEGVQAISGACGFMSDIQHLTAMILNDAGHKTYIGCLMSSLSLLTLVNQTSACGDGRCVLVVTANSDAFEQYYDELILPSWGVPRDKVVLVGLQHVHGFGEEVAAGTTVDPEKAEAGIIAAVGAAISAQEEAGREPAVILSECTELPGYTNALRQAFHLPVCIASRRVEP